MKTVWILTSGEYSGYGIDYVFDSEDAVNEFLKNKHEDEYNDPQEYDIYSLDDMIRIKQRGDLKRIRMQKTGEIFNTYNAGMMHEDTGRTELEDVWNDKTKQYEKMLVVDRYNVTDNQLIKIANEIRLQLIASERW